MAEEKSTCAPSNEKEKAPIVVLLVGLPASGKTTLADAIVREAPIQSKFATSVCLDEVQQEITSISECDTGVERWHQAKKLAL